MFRREGVPQLKCLCEGVDLRLAHFCQDPATWTLDRRPGSAEQCRFVYMSALAKIMVPDGGFINMFYQVSMCFHGGVLN